MIVKSETTQSHLFHRFRATFTYLCSPLMMIEKRFSENRDDGQGAKTIDRGALSCAASLKGNVSISLHNECG